GGGVERGGGRQRDAVGLNCREEAVGGRSASADELAEDLHRFRAGELIRARPAGVLERLAKWVRRRPALALALVLAALVLVLGPAVTGAVWLWRRAEDARASEAEARKQLDQVLYLNQVQLAQREWLRGDATRSVPLLADCAPRLRHWEWDYVRRLSQPLLEFAGPDRWVHSIAYSPDGKRLVTGEQDRSVRVWDAATGKELFLLEGTAPG